MKCARQSLTGFTLVELVMVIVLLGIVAGILAPIISQSVTAYSDTQARSNLTAKGRIALERLAREMRHAIDGSVEVVSGTSIEFITSSVGGRYVEKGYSLITNAECPQNERFDPGVTRSKLCLLHSNDAATNPFNIGDNLVIGTQDPSEIRSGSTFVTLTAAVPGGCAAPSCPPIWRSVEFPNHTFPNESSGKHYAIADFSHELRLVGTTLHWRRTNGLDLGLYDNTAEVTNADPVLVDGVSSLSFSQTATGILQITLTLSDGNDSVTVYHEVYVRNVA